MNIDYLKNEIIPLREREIEDGKHLSTRNPIYVVLDLQENIVSGHSDYSSVTNYKGLDYEFGFVDDGIDFESKEFKESDEGMIEPTEITRFYTDRIIAFFLTSKAAHEYLEYQSHNLQKPYVYVFNCGYRNIEMETLLKD